MDLNDILQLFSNRKKSNSIKLNLISSFVIVIIPILIAVITIFTMFSGLLVIFIGPIYTHVVQRLTLGLIFPLFIVFFLFFLFKIFFTFSKFKFTTLVNAYKTKYKNQALKKVLIFALGSLFFISFLVKENQRTINTIMDIPHIINHEYIGIDGIVKIVDGGDAPSYVMVDDLRFDEGFAYDPDFVDGNKTHVEYLPHSKYIVKLTEIKD